MRHVVLAFLVTLLAIISLILVVRWRTNTFIEESTVALVRQNISSVDSSLRAFMEGDPRNSTGFPRYMERLRGRQDILAQDAKSLEEGYHQHSRRNSEVINKLVAKGNYQSPTYVNSHVDYTLRIVPAEVTRNSTLKNARERIESELKDQPENAGKADSEIAAAAQKEYQRLYPEPDEIERGILQTGLAFDATQDMAPGRIFRATIPVPASLNCIECHKLATVGQPLGVITVEYSLARLTAMKSAMAWEMFTLAVLALLILIALSVINVRSLMRVLTRVANAIFEASKSVTNASYEIKGASVELADGANKQASALEETSSAMTQMAQTTRQSAENSRIASQLTATTEAKVKEGVIIMEEMTQSMLALQQASAGIASFIKVIDHIAFQTNLLALNAAVEAARAGDAGLGFGVVAEEVRDLARRSTKAAKESEEKIESAISRSKFGMETTAKAAAAFAEINGLVRKCNSLVSEISSSSQEQSHGITQVTLSLQQMDQVVELNAANAEECASSAEGMASQADALNIAVNDLMHLVGKSLAIRSLNPVISSLEEFA